MKRRRYNDTHVAGSSLIIPYVRGETHRARHRRRHIVNLNNWKELQDWAFDQGVDLRIKDNSRHWILTRPDLVAEWWPSTAKLVLNRRYSTGIHTHDWVQVGQIIDGSLIPRPKPRKARRGKSRKK
jgi:hypothetical protein